MHLHNSKHCRAYPDWSFCFSRQAEVEAVSDTVKETDADITRFRGRTQGVARGVIESNTKVKAAQAVRDIVSYTPRFLKMILTYLF